MDKGSQYRQPLLPFEHTGIAAVANAAASVLCSIQQNLWDMTDFFAIFESTITLSFDNKKVRKKSLHTSYHCDAQDFARDCFFLVKSQCVIFYVN